MHKLFFLPPFPDQDYNRDDEYVCKIQSHVSAFVSVSDSLVVEFVIVVEEHNEHEEEADPDRAQETLKEFLAAPEGPI